MDQEMKQKIAQRFSAGIVFKIGAKSLGDGRSFLSSLAGLDRRLSLNTQR